MFSCIFGIKDKFSTKFQDLVVDIALAIQKINLTVYVISPRLLANMRVVHGSYSRVRFLPIVTCIKLL